MSLTVLRRPTLRHRILSVAAAALVAAAGVFVLPRPSAADQQLAHNSVVSIADPGTALAVPPDGRLRGYEFAGKVLGVAAGSRLGTGSAAQVAGPGQRLWVFGLEWTTQTDDLGQPQTVTPTLVVDGTRIPVPLPSGFAQNAQTDSSFDTGPMYWLASVPASTADVAVELASAGYAQTFSLSAMARQGTQPSVMYRDPNSWQVSEPLSQEKSVPTPDPSGTVTGAALPIQLTGLTLSWFGPDSPTDLPTNSTMAWLVPQLATDTTNLGMCYPSLPAADVTLALPGGRTVTSTRFPQLGPDQQTNDGRAQGAFTAAYGFQVPASITTATLTVRPGTFQATVGNCATPVTVTATGAATFELSVPAPSPYTAPPGASSVPGVIHNLAINGSDGTGHASSDTPIIAAVAAAAGVLVVGAALLFLRRRRFGSRRLATAGQTLADPPAAPAGPGTAPVEISGEPVRTVSRPAKPPTGKQVFLVPPAAPPDLPDGTVEVQVAGEPGVAGWPPGVPQPGQPQLELLAFLGLHPGQAFSTEQLRERIGVGRERDLEAPTLRRYIGQLRADLGEQHFPEARSGRGYQAIGVSTDAARLTASIERAAASSDPAERARYLAQALALVRGAPFSNAPKGTYGWAFDESLASNLSDRILGAASELAELAIENGDGVLAEWATERGLAVWPTDEDLLQLALTAVVIARPSKLSQAWSDISARLRAHGETPSAALEQHYRRLKDQINHDRRTGTPDTKHSPE